MAGLWQRQLDYSFQIIWLWKLQKQSKDEEEWLGNNEEDSVLHNEALICSDNGMEWIEKEKQYKAIIL